MASEAKQPGSKSTGGQANNPRCHDDFGDSPRGGVLECLDVGRSRQLGVIGQRRSLKQDAAAAEEPRAASATEGAAAAVQLVGSQGNTPTEAAASTSVTTSSSSSRRRGRGAARLNGGSGATQASTPQSSTSPAVVAGDAAAERPQLSLEDRSAQWPTTATTVMLRNIPNRYTAEELLAEVISKGFEGQFDFFYLPIDFTTKRNRGYSFINFNAVDVAKRFMSTFHDQRLTRYSTQKILEVSPALTQGFQANIVQFVRKDAQRIQNPWFRPMIFKTTEQAAQEAEEVQETSTEASEGSGTAEVADEELTNSSASEAKETLQEKTLQQPVGFCLDLEKPARSSAASASEDAAFDKGTAHERFLFTTSDDAGPMAG
eukprot:TRINITY_DN566_c0_g2_i1.p1 TRINITY_DN566_c0_g2~~TRINITY_DN566_c0_g2_i1.p1  ORF type:complete len:423 (-),score=120.42 TRINITY_DN566_c0_g2_i1:485-1606(-)